MCRGPEAERNTVHVRGNARTATVQSAKKQGLSAHQASQGTVILSILIKALRNDWDFVFNLTFTIEF